MDEKRRGWVNGRNLYRLGRLGLGILFLWASWDKILQPQAFAEAVGNYDLLPPALVPAVALFLPWVEAVCGLLLISGRAVKGSAAVVDILMIIFTLAFVINYFRGVDIDCGCFSLAAEEKHGEYVYYILRDLVILGIGLWVLYYKIRMDRFPSARGA